MNKSISMLQLFMIIVIYSLVTLDTRAIISAAGFNSLLVLLVTTFGQFVIILIPAILAKRRSDEFFLNFGEKIFGKWLHHSYILLVMFLFIQIGAVQLTLIQNIYIMYFLPNTPKWVFGFLLILSAALGSKAGIQGIFRFNQGFFFIGLVILLSTPMLLYKDLNFKMVPAFMTHANIKEAMSQSLGFIPGASLVFIILLFFYPYLCSPKKVFRTIGWSIILVMILQLIDIMITILLFGPKLAGKIDTIQAHRYMSIADFIENIEAISTSIWTINVFIALSVSIYVTSLCCAHIFSLKDHKPFSFSVAIVVLGLSSHIGNNEAELIQYMKQWLTPYTFGIEVIPVFYLIFDVIKAKHKKLF